MQAQTAAPPPPDDYPVRFSVDYPDRPLNRVTTGFRIFTAIPILIVLAALGTGAAYAGGVGAGLVVAPTVLLLLFRQKYPRWWFDWNLEFQRFTNRVYAYLFLMDDRYPSTDDHQYVKLDYAYPDAERELNRWLPLVKWFLAIPHFIVLIFLWIAAAVLVLIAWFAILFTARYPRSMFDFVEGVMRWSNRVTAYALTLVTDRYPPFRLNP